MHTGTEGLRSESIPFLVKKIPALASLLLRDRRNDRLGLTLQHLLIVSNESFGMKQSMKKFLMPFKVL